jgi:hypothetical protein
MSAGSKRKGRSLGPQAEAFMRQYYSNWPASSACSDNLHDYQCGVYVLWAVDSLVLQSMAGVLTSSSYVKQASMVGA